MRLKADGKCTDIEECTKEAGVKIVDTRDAQGRSRFSTYMTPNGTLEKVCFFPLHSLSCGSVLAIVTVIACNQFYCKSCNIIIIIIIISISIQIILSIIIIILIIIFEVSAMSCSTYCLSSFICLNDYLAKDND